jgi:hypothetical protein
MRIAVALLIGMAILTQGTRSVPLTIGRANNTNSGTFFTGAIKDERVDLPMPERHRGCRSSWLS